MTFATDLQSTASRLLTSYGRSITFGRVVEGAYNTATSGVAAGTTTSYTGYGHPSPYRATEIDGIIVQTGDINLLVYTTTEPLKGDTATVDSAAYRVMDVQKMSAQGVNIAYRLQVRV